MSYKEIQTTPTNTARPSSKFKFWEGKYHRVIRDKIACFDKEELKVILTGGNEIKMIREEYYKLDAWYTEWE